LRARVVNGPRGSRKPIGARYRRGDLAPACGSPHNQGVGEDVVSKDELEAAIEARRELGAEMEPAVIDAFVARIERRLADRRQDSERALKQKRDHQKDMVLGAMAISVPLLAIAAVFTGLPGVVAICLALVVIAVASSR
jgi:hypothetical protein